MVTMKSVEEQLKKIQFNHLAWGRTEVRELPNILLADEEIFECVNGIYEGGFALLVATNFRVLLIDKKPLNYLTVEDLRFDMINEIDYSHRLMGARISISTGSKNLKFTSYNQPRLRKLINHVQHFMAEAKKQQSDHQEDQNQHLEQINQQLQAYLIAQHQQQEKLHEQLQKVQEGSRQSIEEPEPVQPSPELADYLFAQSLLAQHQLANGTDATAVTLPQPTATGQPWSNNQQLAPVATPQPAVNNNSQLADLYAEGMQEVFGKRQPAATPAANTPPIPTPAPAQTTPQVITSTVSNYLHNPLEINPLRIAYSKLPLVLRNRKFGRPSLYPHVQATLPGQPEAAK